MRSDSTVWRYTKLSANDKRKRQATEACGFDAKAVLSKSNDFIRHNLIQCPRMTKRLWSQAIHLQKGRRSKEKALGVRTRLSAKLCAKSSKSGSTVIVRRESILGTTLSRTLLTGIPS